MRAKKTFVPAEEKNWCARGIRFAVVDGKYLVCEEKAIRAEAKNWCAKKTIWYE